MTDTFYRARLTLEKVDPTLDGNGYPREQATEIAAVNVTADTPGDAMYQIHDHAGSLYQWHEDQADDDKPAVLTPDEVAARISSAFNQLSAGARAFLLPERHRCAICGQPGPIRHEGSSYVCAHCNALENAAKEQAERAARAGGVSGRHDMPDEPGQEGAEAANDPAFRDTHQQ